MKQEGSNLERLLLAIMNGRQIDSCQIPRLMNLPQPTDFTNSNLKADHDMINCAEGFDNVD